MVLRVVRDVHFFPLPGLKIQEIHDRNLNLWLIVPSIYLGKKKRFFWVLMRVMNEIAAARFKVPIKKVISLPSIERATYRLTFFQFSVLRNFVINTPPSPTNCIKNRFSFLTRHDSIFHNLLICNRKCFFFKLIVKYFWIN